MSSVKVVVGSGVAVVGAVVAAAETIPPPESVWPQTVATWIALVIGVIALGNSAMNAHRAGVARALSEAKLNAQMEAIAKEFTSYRTSVDEMLRGFSARIDRSDLTARRSARRSARLLRMMIVSQADRKYLREGLDEIKGTLKEMRTSQEHQHPHHP